ncbi:hypothetical protein HNQ80_002966 [Anaerosolibacter carboniphilus]|uniref:Peptidase MA superfamily protein n=1 Tax=Anaerosolibacter carboniphilus TaxID=1417629 RepID=A0A841KTV8_9FIRM|nr:hypothetical protein [Anaerosolibacter carboniphilus]MBB6216861.1 hypothetical protein [Anaerosolibacter carboniphilus]
MKRNKILCVILFILVTLISSCSDKNQGIEEEIRNFINQQEKLVLQKDVEAYIGTLSWESPEYVAEKKSWMRDIKSSDIQDYQLKIEDMDIRDNQAFVEVNQSYRLKDDLYEVRYPLRLVKERGSWKDGDLKFENMKTKHFIIKYFSSSTKYAEKIRDVCEIAYENVQKRYGEGIEGTTVIKLYKDKEMLRQSVKLSFGWQFAGWYEYPESIKTTEFENAEDYREILEHELIHKLTIKKAENNLPYWFAEGLAMYFSNFQNEPEIYSMKDYYLNTYKNKWMTIEKLEKLNLEIMEDEEEIQNYYDGAGMIVKFMIDTYGEERVKKIIEALGSYDYLEGTGAEVDTVSIQRFHEVIPKILEIDVTELDDSWKAYLKQ